MDHMRISGTKPSSVILSQTNEFKMLNSDAKKYRNKLKGCCNHLIAARNSDFDWLI